MDWKDKQKLDRLVELKAQIKPLEEEAKAIQEHLVKTYGDELPKKHETADGSLTLGMRQNWTIGKPNPIIIKMIGQTRFNQKATMTMTTIKDVGGQLLISKLVDAGELKAAAPTIYYSYKEPK